MNLAQHSEIPELAEASRSTIRDETEKKLRHLPRPRRFSRRHRLLLIVTFAIVAAGLLGTAIAEVAYHVGGGRAVIVLGDGSTVKAATVAETIREKAVHALSDQPAWKVVVTHQDGQGVTEWWSANSVYYRGDFTQNGQKQGSLATDGKSIFQPRPDGGVEIVPLPSEPVHGVGGSELGSYYWYLAEGKPLKVQVGASRDPIMVTLTAFPSELRAELDPDTFLPMKFHTRSEMTGQSAVHSVQFTAITLEELKKSVDDAAKGVTG